MKERLKPVNIETICDRIEEVGYHNWLVEELTDAYMEARKGKRSTHDMHEFELNWEKNILNLAQAIEEKVYEPGSSISFVIFDPMVREIFAAPSKDRSVHHLLHHLQGGWWDQKFIETSTSCRLGKGTLIAILMAQAQMREVTDDGKKKAMLAKLDLSGYFMSLSREKLYERIMGGLDGQFEPYMERWSARLLYVTCKFLWERVLKDDPAPKARRRGPRRHWNTTVLPPRKSLFCQPAGYGIVIGNLTSQLASNIFLDQLDKFVTVTLGYKYYGRYVDDFYIMVPAEDWDKLKRDLKRIENFLRNELGMKMHQKKRYMQSVYKGMPYLGARVYPHCLYPSNRTQAKFRRAVKEFDAGRGNIDTVISYLGHMRHLDAGGFIRKVFREVGWDYEVYLESLKRTRRPMRDLVMEMARKV